MKKFEIMKSVVDFAESCEANGVQLFTHYAPHVDSITVNIWSGGKWTEDGTIEYTETIYFKDLNPFGKLKLIIETVIDKYYRV